MKKTKTIKAYALYRHGLIDKMMIRFRSEMPYMIFSRESDAKKIWREMNLDGIDKVVPIQIRILPTPKRRPSKKAR